MNDFTPVYPSYRPQSSTQTNYIFSYNDGIFYVKKRGTNTLNIFTSQNGTTPVESSSQMSANNWIYFEQGDVVKTLLIPVNVESSGTLNIQAFNNTAYNWLFTFMSNLSLSVNDTNVYTKKVTINKTGWISGFNFYCDENASRLGASFKLRVYKNGIRII